MLRLLPLPDELAMAYKGRLFRHNGWSNSDEGMQALMVWMCTEAANRREVSTVELLAKFAGMTVERFVTQHTMLPLQRAVVARPSNFPHGAPERRTLLWTMALRDLRPGAYFCGKCVAEDFDHHGTPYWRLEHQRPGVYCCSKHGIALSYVETADAFLSSPTDFLENHQVVSEHWVADLQKSEPVQRFLAITADLLARSQPLDERNVSRAARARAVALDMHAGRGSVRKCLVSDLLKQRFDHTWLACVVPGLVERQAGEYWHTVDGSVTGRRAGIGSVVYALVFSVLCESADDAINAMIATTSSGGGLATPRLEAAQVDDEQLCCGYVAAKGSHKAAAANLKLSQSIATRRLGALGLPPLGNLDAGRLRGTINALLQQDISLSDACRENRLALSDVRAALITALGSLDSALGQIIGARSGQTSAPRIKPVAPPRQKPSVGSQLETSSPAPVPSWNTRRVAEPA